MHTMLLKIWYTRITSPTVGSVVTIIIVKWFSQIMSHKRCLSTLVNCCHRFNLKINKDHAEPMTWLWQEIKGIVCLCPNRWNVFKKFSCCKRSRFSCYSSFYLFHQNETSSLFNMWGFTTILQVSLNKSMIFFQLLLGCPTANFGPLSKGQPHSFNVNHCVVTFSTQRSLGAS